MLELSVEETNRIRAALGLRLIPLDGERVKKTNTVAPQLKVHEKPKVSTEKPKSPVLEAAAEKAATETLTSSTSSWLKSLNSRKSRPEPQTGPQVAPELESQSKNPEPDVAIQETIKETNQGQVQADHNIARGPIIEPKPALPKIAPLPEYDPVHTIEEYQPVELQQSDFKDTKPRFKRRKKTSSQLRKTEIMEAPQVQTVNVVDEELEELLARERIARQVKELRPDKDTSTILAVATATPDRSSETTSFLARLKKLKRSEPESAPESKPLPLPETVLSDHSNELATPPNSEPNFEPNSIDQQSEPNLEQPENKEMPQLNSMASTLALLRQAGAVENQHHLRDRNSAQASKTREWSRKVAAAQLMRQHELEIESARLQKLPAHERELKIQSQAEIAVHDEARRSNMLLKDYRPEIDLGHESNNEREAYKNISRAFHGTAEGKKRREKRDRTAQKERRVLEKSIFADQAHESNDPKRE